METNELKQLIDEQELISLKFDDNSNDEFFFEFKNGVTVTVGVTTKWECGVFDIESSIEKERKEKEQRELKEAQLERDAKISAKKQELLKTIEQLQEIVSTFGGRL
jgi:hypothetical protein